MKDIRNILVLLLCLLILFSTYRDCQNDNYLSNVSVYSNYFKKYHVLISYYSCANPNSKSFIYISIQFL